MPFHFGYGSNISYHKLRGNLYGAVLGPLPQEPGYHELDRGRVGFIKGFEPCLRANGTLNMRPSQDAAARVWGVAYRLSDAQYERLHRHEGLTESIETAVSVTLLTGETIAAHSWRFADDSVQADAVRPYYFELIVEAAYQRGGIPTEYIEQKLAPFMLERPRMEYK